MQSYTTRPKRHPNETGHIFVQEEDFEQYKNDICAYTEFDGHKYWTTYEQIDESDLYIIDPAGVESLMLYAQNSGQSFKKFLLVVRLNVSRRTCKKRMLERGDTKEDAKRRLKHDKKAFKRLPKEYVIDAEKSVGNVMQRIYEHAQLSNDIFSIFRDRENKDD